ncbi:FAD binding domain-containing protein [Ruegeria sp. R13_0]|uniref:FAD binding domain-containing protein n=1 Tax=Ruegeria sp. R13_0 TaxID=2821099 RepID=UPI001ADD4510|nr:FAD binding domain-containing protein [Ruegeria sp. R13_0]MBO9436903.1 FAD binding domain-containing protein [Ruegeria sp. R13_0]
MTNAKPKRNRAIVIGGSLGGLFAGNMLKKAGWDVDIYERSAHDLDSRGGGVVLQPDVVEVFREAGVDIGAMSLGVPSKNRVVYRKDGSIQDKRPAPQMQTSWPLIYSTMKETFGDAHYHRGRVLTSIEQDEDAKTVTAIFEDGSRETGDLLVGADGNGSTVRQLIWPDAKPAYAGYLAWRGLIPENDLTPAARDGLLGDFGFSNTTGSHILGYLVPGENNTTDPGKRFYNWVWYRVADDETLAKIMTDKDGKQRGYSMPEGKLSADWKAHVYREADALLPAPFREAVHSTQEPFAQAIRDLTVPSMVNGRVILLGDAAFVPRPHTAASTSKAAANALALYDALARTPEDVDAALERWEPGQMMLGNMLYRQGTQAGDSLLFRKDMSERVG